MILLRLSLAFLALLLGGCGVTGMCGCEDGCEATRSCTSTSTSTGTGATTTIDPADCPADPVDGDVFEGCGIWVSASKGDDGNPGTQSEPVRTLQRGVDLASKGPMRVYACAETYLEPVTIPSGVSLHAGWYCQSAWELGPVGTRGMIFPAQGEVPLRLVQGPGETLVTDLVARAGDASMPGGSSIAAWAEIGSVAELRRVELIAGNGAAGAAGEHGGVKPAASGTPGFGGASACTAVIGLGGEPPVLACDEGVTTGGEGGDGSEAYAQPGGDGTPDLGKGKGGLGEDVAPTCTAGMDGAPGTSGTDGLGASGPGTVTADGYVPASGASGTAGTRAQGGGGGGASYGGPGCGAAPHGGAGGGAGGTGGCGGKPGQGGQGGGASIALVSRSKGIRVVESRLVAASGGAGGIGGGGQVGGLGGLPGLGGAAYPGQPPIHGACSGGFGGKGGDGGNGGGGAGGPSAAIAHLFGAAPAQEKVELVVGKGGEGGLGGNPAVPAGTGAAGLETKVLELGP